MKLLEALRSLEEEGWFAAFSDDPRVIAIREALNEPPDAGVREPREPAPESPGDAVALETWPAPAEVDPNQLAIPAEDWRDVS